MQERIKKIIVVVIILILAIILIPKFNSKVEGTLYHKHTDECYQTIYHTHNEACYETHTETVECGAKYVESNVPVGYYVDEDYYEIRIMLYCEQGHCVEAIKRENVSPNEIDQIRADYEALAQYMKENETCHILTTQTVQTLICGKEEGQIESVDLICGQQEMWGYVVEYLLEDEYGNYNTYRSVEKIAYANTVTENAISIDGYIPKTGSQSVELSYNDDTIIRFYYERTKYPMTIEPQNKIKSLRVEGRSQQIEETNPVNTITGNFKHGEQINIITEIKDGYEFLGWQDQVSGEMITNAFQMKMAPAYFVPITNIITYNIQLYYNNDENTTEQIQYNVESEEITLPIPEEKRGYIFEGWIQNEGDIPVQNLTIPTGSVGNRTYYAKWKPREDIIYVVEHYLQNVNLEVYTIGDVEIKNGTMDSTVVAQAKNYTGFVENTEHQETIKSGKVVVDGSLTLRLYYDRAKYNITFNTNGGTINSGEITEYIYGKGTILPTDVTKSGNTFEGWYEDSTFSGNAVTSIRTNETGNKEYFAKWSKGQYTVTFRDGTTTAKTQTVNYGESATAPSLTRAGYTLSWDKDFSNVTSNIIVNAVWIANTNTAYKVEHYKQTDAGYILSQTENLSRNNRYNSNSYIERIRRIYRKYNI